MARRRWERREAQRRDGGTATSDEKYAYTDAFTADDVQFLRELPYTILLEREAVLVVHAGIVPSVPLHEQRPEHMYTMRNLVRERDGSWQALATTHTGGPWAAEWQPDGTITARHVVFGHDAKRGARATARTDYAQPCGPRLPDTHFKLATPQAVSQVCNSTRTRRVSILAHATGGT